jgi:hypothetical protein
VVAALADHSEQIVMTLASVVVNEKFEFRRLRMRVNSQPAATTAWLRPSATSGRILVSRQLWQVRPCRTALQEIQSLARPCKSQMTPVAESWHDFRQKKSG